MFCRARGDDKLSFSGKHVWLSNTGELCACTCMHCIMHYYIKESRISQEDPATILFTAQQTSRLHPVASCTATCPLSYVLLLDKPKRSTCSCFLQKPLQRLSLPCTLLPASSLHKCRAQPFSPTQLPNS